jgi:uncharacterized phage protein (TIGR02216 family)
MSGISRFDWPALMQVGLHQLGLTPDVFWGLTPVELMLIAGVTAGTQRSLGRGRLAELCAEFPDAR